MKLLDTSVWIEVFDKRQRVKFTEAERREVVTCLPVIQEVLQGARDELIACRLEEGMLALPCLAPAMGRALYLEAAEIYRRARRRGLTVRSSVDCLIAAIALEHDAVVVHLDRDFEAIARLTDLRTEQPRM